MKQKIIQGMVIGLILISLFGFAATSDLNIAENDVTPFANDMNSIINLNGCKGTSCPVPDSISEEFQPN